MKILIFITMVLSATTAFSIEGNFKCDSTDGEEIQIKIDKEQVLFTPWGDEDENLPHPPCKFSADGSEEWNRDGNKERLGTEQSCKINKIDDNQLVTYIEMDSTIYHYTGEKLTGTSNSSFFLTVNLRKNTDSGEYKLTLASSQAWPGDAPETSTTVHTCIKQ